MRNVKGELRLPFFMHSAPVDSAEPGSKVRAMRALLIAQAFCVMALCAVASPAAADRFSLRYEGAAAGFVPLGTITVDANVDDETYQISTTLRTNGLMNLFERTNLDADASGAITANGVYWQSYNLDHRYSHKRRVIHMTRANAATTTSIEPNYRLWGSPRTSDEQIRRSRDPLSTLVAMAVDVSQTRRCVGSYPTFDGRFHYLMELSRGEIDHFRGGGYEGDVLKCRLGYVAVAGFEQSDRGRRRIPEGQVWFALDPGATFAPPVRITTPLSAGGAVIRLTSWTRAQVSIVTPDGQ